MSSFASNDLFNCLAQLLSVYHSPVSVEDLKSGLPLNPANARVELFTGSNLLDNFSRAAARAGFKTRLQQKQLAKISNLVLPAVLVFRDGDGCVLDSIDAEKKTVKILLPEAGDAIIEKTFAELAEIYSGYVFLVGRGRVSPLPGPSLPRHRSFCLTSRPTQWTAPPRQLSKLI